jgi:hypothetical protein
MTKEDVTRAYNIWAFYRDSDCVCVDHNLDNPKVCQREKSWRNYCKARDLYVGKQKETGKRVDLADLFASIEGLD